MNQIIAFGFLDEMQKLALSGKTVGEARLKAWKKLKDAAMDIKMPGAMEASSRRLRQYRAFTFGDPQKTYGAGAAREVKKFERTR